MIREAQNRRFAEQLSTSLGEPSAGSGLIPVESVLTDVVAPVAASRPVLLAVLDGLSQPVFRELSQDLERDGWIAMTREEGGPVLAALATFPSTTDGSRTRLLTGRLQRGDAAREQQGLRDHEPLRRRSSTGWQGRSKVPGVSSEGAPR